MEKKILRVALDGSGDYTRLVEAFEYVRQNDLHDMTILIASGEYDVMQEVLDVKGQEYVDNFTQYHYRNDFTGLFLGNNITVIGDNVADTIVSYTYTGENKSFKSNFSVFHVYDNAYTIKNVTINGKGVRYCLHDDSRVLNKNGECKGYVDNCVMNDNGLVYGACLAGGIIGNSYRRITNSKFKCSNGHYAVYYHTNEGSGNGHIEIDNIFSETGTTWMSADHGVEEFQSIMYVSNSCLSALPYWHQGVQEGYVNNSTLKYWNITVVGE